MSRVATSLPDRLAAIRSQLEQLNAEYDLLVQESRMRDLRLRESMGIPPETSVVELNDRIHGDLDI